jgi:hypothetical protein
VIFAKIDVTFPHHYRLMDISPESVRIPLKIRSKSDPKRAEACEKLARAAALGVWTAALCFTRDHMLDGFCPISAISALTLDEVVDELVRQGLMARVEQDGRAGVIILNYAKHNETKADIDRRLMKDRERKNPERANGGPGDSDEGSPGPLADSVRTQLGFRTDSDRIPFGFQTASSRIPSSESESESESETDQVKRLPSRAPAPEAPRAEPSGDHQELIAHFAAQFERLKGAKPVIGAKGGAGAKKLLQGRTLAEAKAIVDRALSDPWWLDKNPDLAAIAGKINAFIGRRAAPGGGAAQAPLQPATGSWKKAEIAK